MKKLILLAVLVLCFFGVRWNNTQKQNQFIVDRKLEFTGYRVEYFEDQKTLFLHSPDGSKNGIELSALKRAYLYRMNAGDATNGKASYRWMLSGENGDLSIPYFGIDATNLIGILKLTKPEIDLKSSLQRTKEFERDEFNLCTIWAPPGTAEIKPDRKYKTCTP